MLQLSYEKIFSHFLSKIEDYTIPKMTDDEFKEWCLDYLHGVVGDIRFRQAFATFRAEDNSETVYFTFDYSYDDYSDEAYTLELIAQGMTVRWMESEVKSHPQMKLMIGTDKEKKLVDHNTVNQELYERERVNFHKMIRDRDYLLNSYISAYL